MAKKPRKSTTESCSEAQIFERSLRTHKRIVEAESEDVPLAPGVTHVLVTGPDKQKSRLVEKRKSFF